MQIAIYLLGSAVCGLVVGWFLHTVYGKRQQLQQGDESRMKLDNVVRQRDKLLGETANLAETIEAQQAVINQLEATVAAAQNELAAAQEKARLLTKNLFALRTEREDFKAKTASFQGRLTLLQQQSSELQAEFIKSREFYKSEIAKAFEKRKALEIRLDNSQAEYESFSTLLDSSRSEHEAINKMLSSAQERLANLDALEQEVIALQAENAQLRHDASGVRQEIETLQRDAQRYRMLAEQHERQSEVLRSKLDKVERDNLQEIVGIGKVFEQALHELGIVSFRQIAACDISDIARVDSKLNEFKGRMEQDDWIGQARELHVKKYG